MVWSEGMYLAPHHFQAQNRYFEDSLRTYAESLCFKPYGFSGFDLEPEADRAAMAAAGEGRHLDQPRISSRSSMRSAA